MFMLSNSRANRLITLMQKVNVSTSCMNILLHWKELSAWSLPPKHLQYFVCQQPCVLTTPSSTSLALFKGNKIHLAVSSQINTLHPDFVVIWFCARGCILGSQSPENWLEKYDYMQPPWTFSIFSIFWFPSADHHHSVHTTLSMSSPISFFLNVTFRGVSSQKHTISFFTKTSKSTFVYFTFCDKVEQQQTEKTLQFYQCDKVLDVTHQMHSAQGKIRFLIWFSLQILPSKTLLAIFLILRVPFKWWNKI